MSEDQQVELPIGEEQQALPPQEDHKPEDIAAAFFHMQKPRLRGLLNNMSVKQIRRFVMNVAAYPMADAGDQPRTEEEKKAAHLFNEMTLNRTMMQLAYEMQKAQEAEAMKQQKEEGEQENGKET